MTIEYTIKRIIMITDTHAMCGLGTEGIIFIIDIVRHSIVKQHFIGVENQIYDILKIKGEQNKYILATYSGLAIMEIGPRDFNIKKLSYHL